jgi:CheY-like chemotaxis protein
MKRARGRDTVLVIDDDPDVQALIEVVAQTYGIPTVHAFDCTDGLEVLKRDHSRIKMILLDYFLPGMHPAVCAAAILAAAGSIPLVLLTAAEDPAARAAELKLCRWISKPFEPSALARLLTHGIPPGQP